MEREPFFFKQFFLFDGNSAMKLSTDAVLLGTFATVSQSERILDIGTGSGIIALMLAQRSNAEIVGIDIDLGSVEDAKRNFDASTWTNRLFAIHQSLQTFAKSTAQKFDTIVCNPPYFANSQRSPYSSRNLSKHDESLSFQDLIPIVKSILKKKGVCSFIIPTQQEEIFHSLALGNGLFIHRRKLVFPKKSKPANRVLLEYRDQPTKTIEESLLTIREEDNCFTAEYMNYTKIYYLNF